MAFTSLLSLASTDFRMRWLEPYVTEGLNRKEHVVTPRGIYRGFDLSGTGTDYELQIGVDATSGDSVAIYEDQADGFTLTLRRTSTSTIDLENAGVTTGSNRWLVIALYVDYSVGATTTGEFRAYEVSPSDEWTAAAEKDELVVLGIVNVEAAGGSGVPITSSDILLGAARDIFGLGENINRTLPWLNEAPGSTPYVPLLTNGSFERGPVGSALSEYELEGWHITATDADAEWQLSTAESNSGTKSLQVSVNTGSANALIALTQYLDIPIQAGDKIFFKIAAKVLEVPASGAVRINFEIGTSDLSSSFTAVNTIVSTISSVDSSFAVIEQLLDTSAFTGAAFLRSVTITTTGTTSWTGTGAVLRLDDFQLWVEPFVQENAAHNLTRMGHLSAATMAFDEPGGAIGDPHAFFWFDKDAPTNRGTLQMARRDLALSNNPKLELLGPLEIAAGNMDDITIAEDPRLTMHHTTTGGLFSLLIQSIAQSGAPNTTTPIKLYARQTAINADSEFVFAMNASWDGSTSTWDQDDTDEDSFVLVYNLDGSITGYRKDAFAGPSTPWAHTAGFDESIIFRAFEGTPDTTAAAAEPRYPTSYFTGSIAYTLMMDSTAGSGVVATRYYTANTGAIHVTANARWNGGALWVQDDNTAPSARMVLQGGGWKVEEVPSGTGSFAEGVWTRVHETDLSSYDHRMFDADGNFALRASGPGSAGNTLAAEDTILTISNPTSGQSNPAAATAPTANSLYAKNIPKAWCAVEMVGAAGASTPTIRDGFNINSVTVSGTDLLFDFHTNMANANYAITANIQGTGSFIGDTFPSVTLVNNTDFTIRAYDVSAAGPVDFSAALGIGNDIAIFVTVFGEQ